jgi:hypothetical protein
MDCRAAPHNDEKAAEAERTTCPLTLDPVVQSVPFRGALRDFFVPGSEFPVSTALTFITLSGVEKVGACGVIVLLLQNPLSFRARPVS